MPTTNIDQEIADCENALRDFIKRYLTSKLGDDWINGCGVDPERIQKWQETMAEEQNRRRPMPVQTNLLYYTNLVDLKKIIAKNWDGSLLDATLGSKNKFLQMIELLGDLRNPVAHHRMLLPHMQHLIIGVCGYIRSRLTMYKSQSETGRDHFPRIEFIQDNLGNSITPEQGTMTVQTQNTLRPGDVIEFAITANDPLGEALQYGYQLDGDHGRTWLESSTLTITLTSDHVRGRNDVRIFVRSKRFERCFGDWDDYVIFQYAILPTGR